MVFGHHIKPCFMCLLHISMRERKGSKVRLREMTTAPIMPRKLSSLLSFYVKRTKKARVWFHAQLESESSLSADSSNVLALVCAVMIPSELTANANGASTHMSLYRLALFVFLFSQRKLTVLAMHTNQEHQPYLLLFIHVNERKLQLKLV